MLLYLLASNDDDGYVGMGRSTLCSGLLSRAMVLLHVYNIGGCWHERKLWGRWGKIYIWKRDGGVKGGNGMFGEFGEG